ncbi:hypothetical protein Tco_0623815 [Tanacetum coccineum]|uniref:Uncharacterized protein n=1 Tax=Tanacetum coccineum TaxID=301880 RepID=A0ABQ4WCA5_9ASTR
MESASPSSLAHGDELFYLKKKTEFDLWFVNNRSADSLVSSDNQLEDEFEEEEEEEDDDLEYFDTFPTREKLEFMIRVVEENGRIHEEMELKRRSDNGKRIQLSTTLKRPSAGNAPTAVSLQSSADPIQVDSSLVIPYFLLTDDLLECLNKDLTFMSTILALSYPSSSNQLENLSNPIHQVAMPERQTLSYMGNCSTGNDHIARPYTQSKMIQCLKQHMLLTQLQEAGIQLSKDQLSMADIRERINFGPGAFIVKTNALFQEDGVEVYDSDCDDVPNAQLSFMANISSYGSNALAEVHNPDNVDNNMINQGVQVKPSSEQSSIVNHSETKITSDSNIIPYSQYVTESQQTTLLLWIPDSRSNLMLAEESRSKMLLKQQDPMVLEKKVNTTLVDYAVLNQLAQDFEKQFVPQTKLSTEQAFWSQNSMNSSDANPYCRPTKVEVLKELPKVSMVNTSLKKLKHHLAGFDVVVKERTTATAITEGSWGFEHTKAYFRDEIIPFIKALKDLFNTFDQYLIDELSEVQNVIHQMEQVVEQYRLE